MALKDKLMTLEDFKAVRDVDVASNSAQFTEIKADLVNNLKSAINIDNRYGDFEAGFISIPAVGSEVTLTRQTSSYGVKSAIIPCTPGELLNIRGTGAETVRAYCFITADNINRSYSGYLTDIDIVVKVPTDSTRVIVQLTSGSAYIGKSALQQINENDSIRSLTVIADSGVASALSEGQYGFNTHEKNVYYKDGSGNTYAFQPIINQMFYYSSSLYRWSGTALELIQTGVGSAYVQSAMTPALVADSGVASGLNDGEYGINTSEKRAYYKSGGITSSSPLMDQAYWLSKSKLHHWNGTETDNGLNLDEYQSVIYRADDMVQSSYYNLVSQNALYFDAAKRITSGNNVCIVLPVKKGWKIRATVYGGSGNARAYALIDISRMIKYVADASVNLTDEIINITEDGFIVFNSSVLSTARRNKTYVEVIIPARGIIGDTAFVDGRIKRNELLPQYNEHNPVQMLNNGLGMMGFIHSWGIIGASFDSGELNYYYGGTYPSQSRMDYYEYSWGKILQRMNGIPDLYNFSNGGQNARDWIRKGANTEYGYQFTGTAEEIFSYFDGTQVPHYSGVGPGGGCWWLAKDHPKQAYVIVLGSNDINWNHPHDSDWNELTTYDESEYYTAGSVEDIGTYDLETNTDTVPSGKTSGTAIPGIVNSYAAYIGAIIERIIAIQPQAKIFVCTIRNHFCANANQKAIWDEYNQVLADIVADERFADNCYLVDYGKYGPCYLTTEWQNYYRAGGHPNAAGYLVSAYYYNTLIDKIIQDNITDFLQSALIGTGNTIHN